MSAETIFRAVVGRERGLDHLLAERHHRPANSPGGGFDHELTLRVDRPGASDDRRPFVLAERQSRELDAALRGQIAPIELEVRDPLGFEDEERERGFVEVAADGADVERGVAICDALADGDDIGGL